jgi:DNA replication protein DnaC
MIFVCRRSPGSGPTLPNGPAKTLDNFDFSVVPILSKARIMAIAAGDTWLDKVTNLLLFGPP